MQVQRPVARTLWRIGTFVLDGPIDLFRVAKGMLRIGLLKERKGLLLLAFF